MAGEALSREVHDKSDDQGGWHADPERRLIVEAAKGRHPRQKGQAQSLRLRNASYEQPGSRDAELYAARVADQERIAELSARNAELEKLLGESRRSGKRQAAPYSKGSPKPEPKGPGRKSGDAGAGDNRPPGAGRSAGGPPSSDSAVRFPS